MTDNKVRTDGYGRELFEWEPDPVNAPPEEASAPQQDDAPQDDERPVEEAQVDET